MIQFHKVKHSFFADFFDGLNLPFSAGRFFFSHKVLLPSIVPMLINTALAIIFFYLTFSQVYPKIVPLITTGSAWYLLVMQLVVGSLVALLSLFVYILMLNFSVNLLTAPFLSAIAIKKRNTGNEEKKSSLGLHAFPVTLLLSLRLLLIAVIVFLIIFGMSKLAGFLIPPSLRGIVIALNLILTIITFFVFFTYLGSYFILITPLTLGCSFNDALRIVLRYRALTCGLGLGYFIFSIIPPLFTVSHIMATLAGSLIYQEKIAQEITLT